jgi:hypothetical protein
MTINNNNRIELLYGCVTIYSGNNVDKIFRQDLVEYLSPVDDNRICISFISGDKYLFLFKAYLGFEILNVSEALVKLAAIVGLNTPPLSLNKFKFDVGSAPSIEDLQTRLGISSFDNALLIEDTIYFNNRDYSIPGEAFFNFSTLIEVVSAATSVADSCFMNCNSIQNILLSRATSIGENAFNGCSSLKSVSMPLVETALTAAFASCIQLELVYAPSLQVIGNAGFTNCTRLNKLHLPSLVSLGETTYNDSVFTDISGNTIELTIPSALMNANGKNPDGDIVVLTSYNNVTIKTV